MGKLSRRLQEIGRHGVAEARRSLGGKPATPRFPEPPPAPLEVDQRLPYRDDE